MEDLLGREDILDDLEELLENPAFKRIAVTGKWGCGKTFICNMLYDRLRASKWVVKINAWSMDFAEEPLEPIFSEIISQTRGILPDGLAKSFPQIIADFGKTVVSHLVKEGVGVDISNIVGTEYTDEYMKQKNLIVRIKKILEKMVREQAWDLKLPLVILVDELDRCKPDFALKFLERMKHALDVDNVKIVVFSNHEALSKIVTHSYGDVDGNEYLRRFFDRDLQVVLEEPDNFIRNRIKLLNGGVFLEAHIVVAIIKVLECDSLRDIEQIISLFSHLPKQGGMNKLFHNGSFLLSLLKRRSPDVYGRILTDSLPYKEVLDWYFGDRLSRSVVEQDCADVVIAMLVLITYSGKKQEFIDDINGRLVQESFSERSEFLLNGILRHINVYQDNAPMDNLIVYRKRLIEFHKRIEGDVTSFVFNQ